MIAPPHLKILAPPEENTSELESTIRREGFATDPDQQLLALETIWCFPPDRRTHYTHLFARRLGLNESRLHAIMELTNRFDRLKALGLPRDRKPQRLDEDKIFPTKGWFGRYLNWAGPTSAPLAWHFWSAASLIAAAARRNYFVDAGMDEPVFLCDYFFLVGPSGSGKSTAVKKARDILNRTNSKLRLMGKETGSDWTIFQGPPSASFEAWLDEFATYHMEISRAADGESEPTLILRPDCCCFIAQDEAVVLIGKDQFSAERWFNGLFQMSDCPAEWRDAKISAKRDGQARELYNVALTCLFGSAPEHLTARVSSAVFTGGFVGRTIISYRTHSGRMHSSRADTDPVEAEKLATQLAGLSRRGLTRLRMTPPARDWYDEFLAHNHDRVVNGDPRFVGAYERAGWHICKIAGILRLAQNMESGENRWELNRETLELAHSLVELERPGSEMIVGATRPATEAEQLEAIQREIEKAGQISYPALLRKCRYAVSTNRQFQWFLHTLLEAKEITRYKNEYGAWIIRTNHVENSDW